MIRVNLIAGDRRATKSAGRPLQIGQKMTLVGSLLLLAAVFGFGWRYWSLSQREARMATAIENGRREEAGLAEVLKQVALLEQQKAQWQERVALIHELQRGQSAPVHMIDQISRALPPMTWLVSLKQEGDDVTIHGRSTTLAALPDFIGNLEATRFFKRPVDIVTSEVVGGQNDGPDLIGFTIKGTFQMSGLASAPGASAGTGATARAAKGGKVG
jgi:type IV pilus assembly protein PilN